MTLDSSQLSSLVTATRGLLIPGTDEAVIEGMATALKKADVTNIEGKPIRVKILSNVTSDYLADYIRLMLVRSGYAAYVEPGRYGALVQSLLSELEFSPSPDTAAVVFLTHRDVQYPPAVGTNAEQARELVTREVEFWLGLLKKVKVPAVVVSFDLPPRRILDEQDGLAPGGLSWHVRMCNLEIAAQLPTNISLVDAEALQYRVGAAYWHDDRLYYLCKQPFSMGALTEISHTIVAALTGLLGGARKVLVLDLDNTLWGGVVGDDGLKNIEIGLETAEGEAFVALQAYVKKLSERGIILAVCSKNRDEVARAPFREHSGMVLKEDDISCFVANFEDKASNLRHIAKTLNVGLDSLVFVDDNPVERALVRKELPDVLVVELPDEPAHYTHALEGSKAFPLRTPTREDLSRVASYRARAEVHAAIGKSATDMDQFLIGLNPTAHVEKVSASTVDRIVQLIRKTNQFKLNLTLFQEADILESAKHVVAIRLVDRLQDYGIVAVAVTRPSDGILNILNWVMSCRVFGRRLEHAMIDILASHAEDSQCVNIHAGYTPTEKNVILPDILRHLGFKADSSNVYQRPSTAPVAKPHHMKIVWE